MSTPTDGWGTNARRQEAPRAGLIVVDRAGRPVYYDDEAIAVLTYPRPVRIDRHLCEVQASLIGLGVSHATPGTTMFTSGRRLYVCRAFALTGDSGTGSRLTTGLLIERDTPKMMNVSEAAAKQFHLTQREQETIGLLTLGLTSKEIATRMNISPNTVKTFFRLVMTKMGVSTRSGIVGKIARM